MSERCSLVYRVITGSAWRSAQSLGYVKRSPLDEADGFIHLSTSETTLETARRYFRPEDTPLILELSVEALGGSLRWEEVAARGYQRFPHLYQASLPLSAVVALIELELEDGLFTLGQRVSYQPQKTR